MSSLYCEYHESVWQLEAPKLHVAMLRRVFINFVILIFSAEKFSLSVMLCNNGTIDDRNVLK